MNILVVHSTDISDYPPVRNVAEALAANGHKVTVLARNRNNIFLTNHDKIKIINLPENKYQGIFRILNYITRVTFLRKTVDREMENNDILWTTSDYTVRELKRRVLKYKHVMQLMELIEDIPEIPPFEFVKVNLKQYAQRAYKVVVPEYNRACIQKIWWDLKEMPVILPNKPVDDEFDEKSIPKEALTIIENLKREKRKIILYQGYFGIDRNFEMFAEALAPLNNEYCFCLLGADNTYRQKLCEKYPEINYLGYLPPPYHLLITPFAHIGLLTYAPGKCAHYSVLNALYCAPNKIYEYAKYGIPMIGNDVPGLTLPFSIYGIGSIYHGGGTSEIRGVIQRVESEYQVMSDSCLKFYEDTDLYKIVTDIIS